MEEEKIMSAEMREGYVQAAKDWADYNAECEMSTEDLIYNLGQCFALTKAEIIDILESVGYEFTQEYIDDYNDVNDDKLTLKRLNNWINDAAVDGDDTEDDDEDEDEDEEDEDDEDEDDDYDDEDEE